MIPLPFLSEKTVAVLGLGRSGLATARAAVASGAKLLAWDDAAATRARFEEAGFELSNPEAGEWEKAEILVLSPGIPYEHPKPHPLVAAARKRGIEVIGDIDLFVRAKKDVSALAITGTNGKSTTTALIGHILQQAGLETEVGGNIGQAVLALESLESDGFYVLELSSYQLETTPSLSAQVAVLLNISPDHLDRHGGLAGYIAAKEEVFRNPRANSVAVISLDDPACCEIHEKLYQRGQHKVIAISGNKCIPGGIYQQRGQLIDDSEGKAEVVFDLTQAARLPGDHNAQNAAAAYAACRAVGLSSNEIANGLTSFPGLAHRQELLAVIEGVSYVNDSKATNPEAAARALACYQTVYWIAGGRSKDGGFDELAPFLPRIAAAYLIGEAEEALAEALSGKLRFERCGTLDKALELADRDARSFAKASPDAPQPVVLLSPACASFDQYSDFEARGEAFRELVHALPDAPCNAAGGAL